MLRNTLMTISILSWKAFLAGGLHANEVNLSPGSSNSESMQQRVATFSTLESQQSLPEGNTFYIMRDKPSEQQLANPLASALIASGCAAQHKNQVAGCDAYYVSTFGSVADPAGYASCLDQAHTNYMICTGAIKIIRFSAGAEGK